jgi:hypothetical protein
MLDLMLSLMVIFFILIAVVFFVTKASSSSIAEHQVARVGADIVALMDERMMFQDLTNPDILDANLDSVVPRNYAMFMHLEGDFSTGNGLLEFGESLPAKRAITTGRRAALTNNTHLVIITYYIWTRG